MSCCGSDRGTVGSFVPHPRMHSSESGSRIAGIVFEYVGSTGLTAIGGYTRRSYLFPEPGAKVAVDPRDTLSLQAVPVLRRVS
jgi:hypothetical protein